MAVAPGCHNAVFPVVTVTVVLGSLLLWLLPDIAHQFVYDRERVLAGELWRLISGHGVHFSWGHLGFNLVLFSVTGSWLERTNRLQYFCLVTLTILASGLCFLAITPAMAKYGGLSGLVSATVVYLSLYEIRYNHHTRLIWAVILLLFVVKVSYEILTREAVFISPDIAFFKVVPAIHIIGGLVAIILFYHYQRSGN